MVSLERDASYLTRAGNLVGPMYQIPNDPLQVWYARDRPGDWLADGRSLHSSADDDLVATAQAAAAGHRDDRQKQVRDWVVACWGEQAVTVNERIERLVEEVFELAQAEGVTPARLATIQAKVYEKEPGDPSQEVGGIGTTLLAYCAGKGLSADECERRELTRILRKPVEHFRARHAAKVESGLAQALAPASAPAQGGVR